MIHFASKKAKFLTFSLITCSLKIRTIEKFSRTKGDWWDFQRRKDGSGERRNCNCSLKNLPTGFKRQHGAVVRLVILSCLAGGGYVFRHDDAVPDRGNLPAAGACSRAGTEHTIHHARWRANAETAVLTSPLFFFFFWNAALGSEGQLTNLVRLVVRGRLGRRRLVVGQRDLV